MTDPPAAGAEPSGPDLDVCAREPIHTPGAIQPYGCLLLCSVPAWTIEAISANAADVLGREAATLLGRAADSVLPAKTLHDLRNVLQASLASGAAERLLDVPVDDGAARFDVLVHMTGPSAVIEIVPRAGAQSLPTEPITLVRSMTGRLGRAATFERFLQVAAQQVRAVTGYDRVMIYKFLEDGTGEVVAEGLRSGLGPFLGLRYPASDIPAQARALYRRQWLRLVPDVDYEPAPLVTAPGGTEHHADLSLATLRSASPIHLEYLRNMGSRATLTLSIVAGDRLWGLVACHHHAAPRRIAASTCAALELFAHIFSSALESREQARVLAEAERARELCTRLVERMSPHRTPFDDLAAFADDLRALVPCDGLAAWSDGRVETVGVVPSAGLAELVDWLEVRTGSGVFATSALAAEFAPAAAWAGDGGGLVAVPFRRTPRNLLLFFRREVLQTVTWGGNPDKAVVREGGRIGPRRSFEAWAEIVRGTSRVWRPAELRNADALRVALFELIVRRADLVEQDQRAVQDSQTILIAELNHRVRNILTLIRSLVRQSLPGARGVESYAADLEDRIGAMALAHDQLTTAPGSQASIQGLFEAEARAWLHSTDRVTMHGPPLVLNAGAFQTLALVIHEMITNAAKYGCLSVEAGRLEIRWARDGAGDLRITWTETGGPTVRVPERRGFGTFIVDQVIPFELGGAARIDYDPGGVVAQFVVPAAHVGEGEAAPAPPAAPRPAPPAGFPGARLLLVEDSMMIALDARAMLAEEGLDVDIAGTMAEARRLLATERFDAAILDVNLSGERSFGLGDECVRRGVPFVFATGYGEGVARPERFRSVPVVSKPYGVQALTGALAAMRMRDAGGGGTPGIIAGGSGGQA